MFDKRSAHRRTVLKAIGGSLAGGLALTGTASASGDYGNGNGVGAFLNEEAFAKDHPVWSSGVTDKTGQSEVTVQVGAITSIHIPEDVAPEDPPEEGPFAFAPRAVKVSPGTDVVWQWLPGIHHTVTSYNPAADTPGDHGERFDFHGEGGDTHRTTFDAVDTYLYFCFPHGTPYPLDTPIGPISNLFGMRGAVIVSDD